MSGFDLVERSDKAFLEGMNIDRVARAVQFAVEAGHAVVAEGHAGLCAAGHAAHAFIQRVNGVEAAPNFGKTFRGRAVSLVARRAQYAFTGQIFRHPARFFPVAVQVRALHEAVDGDGRLPPAMA